MSQSFTEFARDFDIENNLFTRQEVAEYAGVSTGTVDYWTRRGHLEPVRFGRAVRFEREAVEALIAKRAGAPRGKLQPVRPEQGAKRPVTFELTDEQAALVASLLRLVPSGGEVK